MPEPDQIPILTALIELAEVQLVEAWAEVRDQNTYALALAGFGVATAGIVVAAQTSLGGRWWVPIPGLAVASFLALFGTRRAHTDLGPEPTSFYAAFGAVATQDALAQLLADLIGTQHEVPATLRAQRVALLRVAALFLATAVYSTLLLA
jgi:hypothetical protein